jgi:predicted RNA methylase
MSDKFDELVTEQTVPMHYHFNMLNDSIHLQAFKEAIDYLVKPGDRVLDLGGGTGILSFMAAQRAAQVIYVERDADLVKAARRIIPANKNGDKVEIVHADANHYLPSEPVDVVICDMLHVGMLREQQLAVIDSFKRRYQERFSGALPRFIPEACIQAVQPIEQDFSFEGFCVPNTLFQVPTVAQEKTVQLAPPEIFQLFAYDEAIPQRCECDQRITVANDGQLNAVRIITKNILAIIVDEQRNVEWFNQYLVVPLEQALQVKAGDQINLRFSYLPGAQLNALANSLQITSVSVSKTVHNSAQYVAHVS